ncbi:MAG: hypothetical protein QOJ11_896 [Frankiales bacterium]|nr:hypothetical protein [Frankiales bacterium]
MTVQPLSPPQAAHRHPGDRAGGLATVVTPSLVAAVLAYFYVRHTPLVADLAAQTARGELFTRSGEVAWWTGWYGGIATSSYSLVTPGLLGWLGPVVLGAVSLVATPLAAIPLLRPARRPLAGGVVLALTAAADVATGRTTFAAGVVVALLSLSAAVRGRSRWAAGLAMLAVFTSPVAGLLGLLIAVSVAALTPLRRPWLCAGAGALAGLAALWWLAGGRGSGFQPFGATDFVLTLLAAGFVLVAPVGRILRGVALASCLAAVVAFVVPSPIGSNLTRIVLMGAAPAVIANARLRPRWLITATVLSAMLPGVLLVGSMVDASRPGSSEQFVAALRSQLAAEPLLRSHRLEVVDVATHWPSARLLPTVTLARGWERQADEELNPELYQGPALTPTAYRQFLDRNAVAFIAVPRDAPLDFGTVREAALIGAGLPYLTLSWSNASWELYAVRDPTPVVAAPATDVQLTDTGALFSVPRAGSYAVRVNWSSFLVVTGGTVSPTPEGDVQLQLTGPGTHQLHAVWRVP